MNFQEYCKSVKDIKASDEMYFYMAIGWLHPERLPLGVAFLKDKDLKIVKVPEMAKNRYGKMVKVITVSEKAFVGNSVITDVILPPTVDRLPKGAFAVCRSLRNITIPKKIKKIEEKTFDGCVNLKNFFYEGTVDEWKKIEIVHYDQKIKLDPGSSGSPVHKVLWQKNIFIPGNEALFTANIHFRCDLKKLSTVSKSDGKDITFKDKLSFL